MSEMDYDGVCLLHMTHRNQLPLLDLSQNHPPSCPLPAVVDFEFPDDRNACARYSSCFYLQLNLPVGMGSHA